MLGPALARVSTWNGRSTPSGTEHLVDRGRFDEALFRDATRAGVACVEGHCDGWQESEHGCRLLIRPKGGEAFATEVAFVVDARGRAASVDRSSSRRGAPTTALARSWTAPRALSRQRARLVRPRLVLARRAGIRPGVPADLRRERDGRPRFAPPAGRRLRCAASGSSRGATLARWGEPVLGGVRPRRHADARRGARSRPERCASATPPSPSTRSRAKGSSRPSRPRSPPRRW